MEEELKKIGIELARLAKKYNESYFSIGYVNKSICANSDPTEKNNINIYIDEEELEKWLKEN